jgi:MFS family permease
MFYNFSFFGMLALGGPLLGRIADLYGLSRTTAGAAICCLLISICYLYLNHSNNHIFAKRNMEIIDGNSS